MNDTARKTPGPTLLPAEERAAEAAGQVAAPERA